MRFIRWAIKTKLVPSDLKVTPHRRGTAPAWAPTTALFVGSDGDRITRGTLQYRVLRAFRRAGIDGDRAKHRPTRSTRSRNARAVAGPVVVARPAAARATVR